ncbi:glycoside hydrolase family 15 protein [Capillimicrobium parvum]|uniref:Trehalase n=1 Tax=Capillimicrobium parvum TaxID=2884022 RepID=A0A9E7C3B4_9ACTN|nr:glycoside hydrolase family 15 protein [Capillimicrobium parvum]UGS38338.1 Trehalase [Capillimicrobium parvum]
MSRPLHDLALISDGHGAALVARDGAIEWCCLPRFDHGSCFAALLDDERGGRLTLTGPGGAPLPGEQRYLPGTLVLETELRGDGGRVRVLDALATGQDGEESGPRLLRVIEGVDGRLELELRIAVRFDYGAVRPWLRRDADDLVWAIGGDDGLCIWVQGGAGLDGDHDVVATLPVAAGERVRLSVSALGAAAAQERGTAPPAAEVDAALEATIGSWRAFSERLDPDADEQTRRSALVLRGLTYEPTGAVLAAPTTSLPEVAGGRRNWDYRFSWIRDSSFAARTQAVIGCEEEGRRFGRFVLRSAAGHADEMQIVFGIGGERHLPERELDLAGYRGSRPVRVGNGAAGQLQLDALGELVTLTWAWHERGQECDADEWRFVRALVDLAARSWRKPDRGIWEWRAGPRHFVHSKAACWAALDCGMRLAEAVGSEIDTEPWRRERDAVRAAVLDRGWDAGRGTFRQAFDGDELDAAVLLLPVTGIVDWDDERMRSTADAVAEGLDDGGLIRRYDGDGDGLPGREGAFLACTFWLAEVYAHQGRLDRAREVYDRAAATASPLGLFSEEHDPHTGMALGNYPQALTHLAQIAAATALREATRPADQPA